jgi:hypothetical protein
VEDESHFLIRCPFYSEIRTRFPDLFTFPSHLDDPAKALLLLNSDHQNKTAKYVHEALDLRGVLLDSQSTLSDIISRIESCEERSKKEGLRLGRIEDNLRRKVSKEEEKKKCIGERVRIKTLRTNLREQTRRYAILSREERLREKEKEKIKIKISKDKRSNDTKLAKLLKMAENLRSKIASLSRQ